MNALVSTNVSTLKKLHLKLDSDSSPTEGKAQLTRSYSQVNLSFLQFNTSTGLWLTSDFCSNLRVLKIMHMEFKMSDEKLLRKTFQALQHLETLQMYECDIESFNNSMVNTIEHVEVKTLKSIHLSATHLGVRHE